MKVEYINIENLNPYVNNSRTHDKEQIKQIAESISEFGFTNPILIDENRMVIAGHGRLEASKLLNMESVPTITLHDLTDLQKKAYIIADNKLALNAGWDYEILKEEVLSLGNEFDLEILGFDDQELANILDNLELIDPELEEQEYKEIYNIVVNCENEQHQEKVYNELLEKGYKCQVQSL